MNRINVPDRRWAGLGLTLLFGLAVLAWADVTYSWFAPAYRTAAHLFYEQSPLAEIREPSQIPLARVHATIWLGMVGVGWIGAPWVGRHGTTLVGDLLRRVCNPRGILDRRRQPAACARG